MTVSKHAQYEEPETEAAKRSLDIIHFIVYTCAFPISIKKAYGIYMILIQCYELP